MDKHWEIKDRICGYYWIPMDIIGYNYRILLDKMIGYDWINIGI